jgi:uroporphyrinogen-III synthase
VVIGAATAAAARAAGFPVTHMPDEATADALACLLAALPYRCVVYPCSARARNALHALPQVCALPLYTTELIAQPPLDLTCYDGVVFSSSSTVAGFFAIYASMPPHITCFAFGRPTHAALCAHAVPVEQIIVLQAGV